MVDPLYTTIIDGSRPMGLLMVGIGIDVPDADCVSASSATCRNCATATFAA